MSLIAMLTSLFWRNTMASQFVTPSVTIMPRLAFGAPMPYFCATNGNRSNKGSAASGAHLEKWAKRSDRAASQ